MTMRSLAKVLASTNARFLQKVEQVAVTNDTMTQVPTLKSLMPTSMFDKPHRAREPLDEGSKTAMVMTAAQPAVLESGRKLKRVC